MLSHAARRIGGTARAMVGRHYSASPRVGMGFEEFVEEKLKPGEMMVTGRAWTTADLRRKSFDDLHKLWYVLYKERNLLLSQRDKSRRALQPILKPDENRYMKVKKSMAGIKVVMGERKKIQAVLDKQAQAQAPVPAPASELQSKAST